MLEAIPEPISKDMTDERGQAAASFPTTNL
jgi:hypothetical protein